MPYWAELWPAGVALARAVSGASLGGKRVAELGCGGLALPSLAAALAGARVLATDWAPDALPLATLNAERNGTAIETAREAWGTPEALVERAPWHLVLAADVLYEQRNVEQLLDLLPRLIDERGEVWLADPGRATLPGFLERAHEAFSVRETADAQHPTVTIVRLRLP